MRLVVTGRHVEITPDLRKLVERKLAKLDRVLGESIVSAQVVLALERYRHIAEITVHARGDHMLHGLGDTRAWQTSLAEAVDKLTGQIAKVKGKWERRTRA
jgi:putative sigma-54 modulation protein